MTTVKIVSMKLFADFVFFLYIFFYLFFFIFFNCEGMWKTTGIVYLFNKILFSSYFFYLFIYLLKIFILILNI